MDSLLEPEDTLRERYLSAPWGELGRSATLGIVSAMSKFVLQVMNTLSVENLDTFHHHVMQRKGSEGLITVSNHTSTIDDPMLFSAMLPWSFFLTEHVHGKVRWSLCARELCYRNAALAAFFKSGKTLPIERGAGAGQPVMRVAAGEVSRGGWVHVFPEGRINYTEKLAPLRWGVGKIFCDAVVANGQRPPTVLPFYHSGMGDVLPRRGRLPRAGHTVSVLVGEPIPLHDLAKRCIEASKKDIEAQTCVWKDVAERIAESLRALEARAPVNTDQIRQQKRRRQTSEPRQEGALPVTEGEQ